MKPNQSNRKKKLSERKEERKEWERKKERPLMRKPNTSFWKKCWRRTREVIIESLKLISDWSSYEVCCVWEYSYENVVYDMCVWKFPIPQILFIRYLLLTVSNYVYDSLFLLSIPSLSFLLFFFSRLLFPKILSPFLLKSQH